SGNITSPQWPRASAGRPCTRNEDFEIHANARSLGLGGVLHFPTRRALDLLTTLCIHPLLFRYSGALFALRERLTLLFSNTTAPFGKSNYGVGYPLGRAPREFPARSQGGSPLSKIVLQSL